MIIPPYLKPGDTIAITCPAGYMPVENAATCIDTLQKKGYRVVTGKTLGSQSQNYFSGTDDERLSELQGFLDDKKINAVLFGRGGYGTGRIIDRIDFKKFAAHPKWLIGFSDITVLHTHLLSNYKIASLHAPMAAAFNDGGADDSFVGSLLDALSGIKAAYTAVAHPFNKPGAADGKIVGGNLALLANVIGTPSDFNTKNRILFLEDIGEYLYNADRMLYQLLRAGKFSEIAGLVVGGFTDMKDTPRPFGQNIDEIIRDIVSAYDFPVCYKFPVSHGKENMALKQGVKYRLKVTGAGSTLTEL